MYERVLNKPGLCYEVSEPTCVLALTTVFIVRLLTFCLDDLVRISTARGLLLIVVFGVVDRHG